MVRGTTKSCHGCGSAERRGANELCERCAEALRAGMAVLEASARRVDGGVLVRLQSHWPTIYHDVGGKLAGAIDSLARASLSLAKEPPYAAGELPPGLRRGSRKGVRPLPDDERVAWFSTNDPKAEARRGPRRVVDAIERLDIAARAALAKAYEDGLADGQNILLQMAQGKVTMESLTEETIAASKIKRRR